MPDGPPTNLTSLEARLRNHCSNVGHDYGRARRHVGAMVVAHMLEPSGTVVKGGRNLEIRYGLRATRASTDLDVVRTESLDYFLDGLDDALEAGWEGFTGRLVDEEPIDAPVPDGYLPHRVQVKIDFKGKPFGTVQLEIAVEEAGGLQDVDTATSDDATAIFSAVGLSAPPSVAVMPLPVQMAQKLHACTTPDTVDWINDRAHDLIDLQVIRRDLPDERLRQVRVATERLFASRRRHQWPPTVTARDGWEARYAEERDSVEDEVIATLGDALVWTQRLIDTIADA